MTENRIRQIRRINGLSGTKIADKLGISAQYYYDIEKGKRNLSAEMAAKLAEIFGVSTDYLLGISDEKEPILNNEDLDEDIRTIQRAARRMSNKDRKKMMDLIRLTFEEAFNEDDDEDDDDDL